MCRLSVQLLLVIVAGCQRFLPLTIFSVKIHLPLLFSCFLFANTANQLATLHSLCLTADVRSVPDRKGAWISKTNEASRHLVDVVDKRYLSVGNIWKCV